MKILLQKEIKRGLYHPLACIQVREGGFPPTCPLFNFVSSITLALDLKLLAEKDVIAN